jgi:hypothetical protein
MWDGGTTSALPLLAKTCGMQILPDAVFRILFANNLTIYF